jgi:hypothetical protein
MPFEHIDNSALTPDNRVNNLFFTTLYQPL